MSSDNYWCTYCKGWVSTNPIQKKTHETGMRHKGNLERFIRGIYKQGAKAEREKAAEAREMRAIEEAAHAAVGGSAPRQARPPPRKESAQPSYTTPAELGFEDEDAQRALEAKELRNREGRAGEWTVVSSTSSKGKGRALPEDDQEEEESKPKVAARDEPDPKTMSFRYLTERSLPVDDDDDYDQVAVKVTRKEAKQSDLVQKAKEQARGHAGFTTGTKKGVFFAVKAAEVEEETEEEIQARQQAAWDLIAESAALDDAPKEEKPDVTPAAAPMFKKRKAGASAASSSSKRRT